MPRLRMKSELAILQRSLEVEILNVDDSATMREPGGQPVEDILPHLRRTYSTTNGSCIHRVTRGFAGRFPSPLRFPGGCASRGAAPSALPSC